MSPIQLCRYKKTSILFVISFISTLFILYSCKKTDHTRRVSEKTRLITERPWKLVARGEDDNRNDRIDAVENDIMTCEQDDVYTFRLDTLGVKDDNTMLCAGNPRRLAFTWGLRENETKINFNSQHYVLTLLSKDSMFLMTNYPDRIQVGIKFAR